MKKPGKTVPLLLLACMLTFASGCGTDKNTNQGDMANNNTNGNQQENAAQTEGNNDFTNSENNLTDGNDAFTGTDNAPSNTEAFDGTGIFF